jgi:outer membrane protein OmpA-like peptidoglycan-associated protein
MPTGSPTLVPVDFAAGSSVLPRGALGPLHDLAGRRKNASIVVTGRGEAPSSNPDIQAAALQLGLQRAQTIASALTGDGVPASAIRLDAEAAGRGGWARLVD